MILFCTLHSPGVASMRFVVLLLLAASALQTGCVTQQRFLRQSATLDSLYAAHRALQDSVQLYEDLETGQYFRDVRTLQDRVDRLEYKFSLVREGGHELETFRVGELFEPASAVLTPAGVARLDRLAETLKRSFAGRAFRVEGHSDSIPPGRRLQERYPSNWELSAARAAAVVRHLSTAHALDAARFEIVSYGATRPVARNDHAEGRRHNRRVRITVLPAERDLNL